MQELSPAEQPSESLARPAGQVDTVAVLDDLAVPKAHSGVLDDVLLELLLALVHEPLYVGADVPTELLELVKDAHPAALPAAEARNCSPLTPGTKKYSPPLTVTTRCNGPKKNGGLPGTVILWGPSAFCAPTSTS